MNNFDFFCLFVLIKKDKCVSDNLSTIRKRNKLLLTYILASLNIYIKMCIKGRVHVFFIRELDVPLLGESNLLGPKKSVEVKFFTEHFLGCGQRY